MPYDSRMEHMAISKACRILHGKAKLARVIGVSSPTVHQWISGHRPIPIERCVAIERATGGAVTRRDLRPNDWQDIWPELADADHPAPAEAAA